MASLLLLMACGGNSEKTVAPVETEPEAKTETQAKAAEPATAAEANTGGTVLAMIDMGDYIFRVHEIIQYHPKEMQAKLLKLDDSRQDFYVLDCSIENKTEETINVRLNSLSAYCKLSDQSTFGSMLRGGVIVTSYNLDNGEKYPKAQYDLLWSKTFPAKGKARAHLYGVEVPEGITITGIGFYEKNKTKNVSASINP